MVSSKHISDQTKIGAIMESKTKLVLLEFLSLIPEEANDEIDAISNLKTFDSSNISEKNNRSVLGVPEINSEHVGNQKQNPEKSNEGAYFKYHTFSISESDRKSLMDQIAAHVKNKSGKPIARSKSFETKQYYMTMRKKMLQMMVPIRKYMSENTNKGSKELENQLRKKGLDKQSQQISPRTLYNCTSASKYIEENSSSSPGCGCTQKRSRANLKLTIPCHNELKLGDIVETANTYAVNRLEEISNELMTNFPNLFNGPICEILTPLQTRKEISYNLFSQIARTVLMLQLQGVMTSIWHKVSMVMSLVKETMVVGNLDDEMMELMVDHSTKFLMENVMESIEEEGGWEVLNVNDSNNETLEDVEEFVTCGCQSPSAANPNQGKLKDRIFEWLPFAIALLAVGLGLAYSLR